MLILSPADRAALWQRTVTADADERDGMLRVLAKELQDVLASDLDLYSAWDETLEATFRTLDASGLIGRDELRRGFEVVGIDEDEGGIPAAEFALMLAGVLDETATISHVHQDVREGALALADMWRTVATSEEAEQAPPETLTVSEVAAHFGVTPQAVYKWCEAGKIEFKRTPGGSYRIPSAQFDWARGQDTAATRREVAERLLRKLEGVDLPDDDEMVDAMRKARR